MPLLSYNKGPRIAQLALKCADDIKAKDGDGVPVDVSYALDYSKIREGDACNVSFDVNIEGEKSPFTLTLTIEIIFDIKAESTEEELTFAVFVEGGPILFMAAQEHVADLTRKMYQPPLYLPLPDFKEFHDSKQKEMGQEDE